MNELSGVGNVMDMGDRWLDTRLGRTFKMDRKGYLYPDLSPYSYSANNPILFVDPDGEEIRIHFVNSEGKNDYYTYGSKLEVPDNSFVRNTIAALDKISKVDEVNRITTKKEPTPAEMLIKLSNDKTKIVDIKESLEGNSHQRVNVNNSIVNFDQNKGSEYLSFDDATNSGRVTARNDAAGGLNHELRHAFGWLFNNKDFIERRGNKKMVGNANINDKSFPNDEEYNTSKLDSDYIQYYGYGGERESYYGKKYYSISPTSIEPCVTCGVDINKNEGQQIDLNN